MSVLGVHLFTSFRTQNGRRGYDAASDTLKAAPRAEYSLRGCYWFLSVSHRGDLSSTSSESLTMCKSFFTRIVVVTAAFFSMLAASPSAADVQAKIVEFYNQQLDAYFITARVDEQAVLDGVADFRRTGMSFTAAPAFQPAPADYISVCRFFISTDNPFVRSHFYGRGDIDCADLLARSLFPIGFIYEGEDFKTLMPVSGACTEPASPIYRGFRALTSGKTSNHRYSASMADHIAAQRAGYVDEGVAFCGTGATPRD
jgi:hypothetical protein